MEVEDHLNYYQEVMDRVWFNLDGFLACIIYRFLIYPWWCFAIKLFRQMSSAIDELEKLERGDAQWPMK